MRRFIFYFCVTMFCNITFLAMSQNVISLKNGSIIKGALIEMTPTDSLKIKTPDGSLFIVAMSEVDKITEEKVTQKESPDNHIENYLKRGFRIIPELGFHVGEYFLLMASCTAGYQLNQSLFVGGGIAPAYNGETYFVPIYCSVRYDLFNANKSPFLDGHIGYSIGDDYNTGLYLYVGGGYRMKKLSLSAGYTSIHYGSHMLGLNYFSCSVGYEF